MSPFCLKRNSSRKPRQEARIPIRLRGGCGPCEVREESRFNADRGSGVWQERAVCGFTDWCMGSIFRCLEKKGFQFWRIMKLMALELMVFMEKWNQLRRVQIRCVSDYLGFYWIFVWDNSCDSLTQGCFAALSCWSTWGKTVGSGSKVF